MKTKTPTLRIIWIALLSGYYTAYYCSLATLKQLFGTMTRPWVDDIMQRWSQRLLRLIGANCIVINPNQIQPPTDKPVIIMCNHTSLYDIPISFKAFPNHSIRMLAKKEIAKVPFLGTGMVMAECPFIDRKNREQAIKDLQVAKQLMKSGIIMWIAPEGTRSKDGKLASFKKGPFITAIEANASIIPIGIRGAFEILPAKTLRLNLNQTVEIHIGEIIDASLYTMANKDELINKTHQQLTMLVGS